MTVITISASYAAGGSEIGPVVAERLGVPFVDRAISVTVAEQLGITVEEAEAVEQDAPSRVWSLVAGMSLMPGFLPVTGPVDQNLAERTLFEYVEAEIRRVADHGSCVILGRAAALVLAQHPNALHVRLDGPVDGRIEAAMAQHGIDRGTAKAAQKSNDRLRSSYVEHFYRVDPAKPFLYHLVLDTVRLRWDEAEEIILAAARAHGPMQAG